MDELRQLRDHHDALPAPTPESTAAARARLNSRMRGAPRHSGPRFTWLRRTPALWGALAGVAGVTVFAVTTSTAPPPPVVPEAPPQAQATVAAERMRPVADAEDLAHNAAVTATREGERAPQPTEWVYMKSVTAQTRQVGGGEPLYGRPKRTSTHEQWRRADDKGFAYFEGGKLQVGASQFEVAYPYLLSMPHDPADTLARVYATVEEEYNRSRENFAKRLEQRGRTPEQVRENTDSEFPPLVGDRRDMYAFQHIAQGMGDAALPSKVRAALYGAMAKIPGVRYEARASDIARRKGVTLYLVQEGYKREEIFIDPKTYQYLGYRLVVVKDHREKDEFHDASWTKGEILDWDGLLKTAIVDEPGERP
ncbi:CU044_5270 family protein [Sinosporangium siamense]|uniref:CU044_5270 family protein n=1 Tax=Sinosporangium siamense TaxID=1367973 RepID=A0A919VAT5_9ACTN|nr:CU044_5270 family protein [Sinosporangium siamense]GII96738.1 hypothetical protein Ssi02_69690 [Sinosporangium siamense]